MYRSWKCQRDQRLRLMVNVTVLYTTDFVVPNELACLNACWLVPPCTSYAFEAATGACRQHPADRDTVVMNAQWVADYVENVAGWMWCSKV